jgi:hypothetical protein
MHHPFDTLGYNKKGILAVPKLLEKEKMIPMNVEFFAKSGGLQFRFPPKDCGMTSRKKRLYVQTLNRHKW